MTSARSGHSSHGVVFHALWNGVNTRDTEPFFVTTDPGGRTRFPQKVRTGTDRLAVTLASRAVAKGETSRFQ